jgi:hypothetical protein
MLTAKLAKAGRKLFNGALKKFWGETVSAFEDEECLIRRIR